MKTPPAKAGRPRTLCAAIRHARKTLCFRLQGALREPDDMFVRGFATLVAEVEAGFRHEELIMGTLGYARLREQRAENAVVLSALHRVLPEVEDGNAPLGRQVITALIEVLALHRLSTGLALSRCSAPAAGARQRGARHPARRRQGAPPTLAPASPHLSPFRRRWIVSPDTMNAPSPR